jgi:cytochrome c-type biogenesis protein CcmE
MAMERKKAKFLILGGGILLCVAFLVVVGTGLPGGLVYYLTVTELLQSPDRMQGGFRVNGTVAAGSVVRSGTGGELGFVLTDGTSSMPVHYRGAVPDAFAEGGEVVVDGRLGENGTFEAHTLIAKCPSKYEAAGVEHPEDIPKDE